MIVAVIFIGRSGHTAGVPVPGIELKIRAFLEQAFLCKTSFKRNFYWSSSVYNNDHGMVS